MVKLQSITNWGVVEQIHLPAFTAILSAELAAIKTAIFDVVQMHTKTLICTDSLAVVKSIFVFNINGVYDNIFINPIVQYPIIILWIPSHIDIFADNAAKEVLMFPLIISV